MHISAQFIVRRICRSDNCDALHRSSLIPADCWTGHVAQRMSIAAERSLSTPAKKRANGAKPLSAVWCSRRGNTLPRWSYNLGNFLRTLAAPEPIKDWSLTSLKERLTKIGAKVVSHGRYESGSTVTPVSRAETFR